MNESVREAERLFKTLSMIDCDPDKKWDWDSCLELAPLTLEINQLKKEQNALILAHSYVTQDIIYGVADFYSDSYALSLAARDSKAQKLIFSGVVFMAETAKILSPEKEVLVPDRKSGCSLADSITCEELIALKARYPKAAVVCYINSNVDIKALSDVCVTSSNVMEIISKMPQKEILFVPDRLMADNIRLNLKEKGIEKIIHSSDGFCHVHERFDKNLIALERSRYKDLVVVSHPECQPEVTEASDFVGSTGKMLEFVKNSPQKEFMMLTECGLVGRLEAEHPEKKFLASCRVCEYMKMNSLEKIKTALTNPKEDQKIEINEEMRLMAKKSLDKMFEMTN